MYALNIFSEGAESYGENDERMSMHETEDEEDADLRTNLVIAAV